MPDVDPTTPVTGPYGSAEPADASTAPATIVAYVVTAPAFHPAWSQYMVCVVSLAPIDGVKPAHLQFPGATHELLVAALDPAEHYTSMSFTEELNEARARSPYLQPVNVVHQFEATASEMRELACRAIVHGQLNPETSDAPSLIRQTWLTACVRTLAHIRGEEHAP